MRDLVLKYFPYAFSTFFLVLGFTSVGMERCTSGFVIAWVVLSLFKALDSFNRAFEIGDAPIYGIIPDLLSIIVVSFLNQIACIPLSHLFVQPRVLSVAISLGFAMAMIAISQIFVNLLWHRVEPLMNKWHHHWLYREEPTPAPTFNIPQLCQQCRNCSYNPFLLCAIHPDGPVNDACHAFDPRISAASGEMR